MLQSLEESQIHISHIFIGVLKYRTFDSTVVAKFGGVSQFSLIFIGVLKYRTFDSTVVAKFGGVSQETAGKEQEKDFVQLKGKI